MKKKLRLISLSLMLAMIAGTAVSCNSKGEQTETTEGDTTVVNLTMYEWGWEGPEEGMDEVAPLIKEATGVEINLSRWIVNSEEDYRRQILIDILSPSSGVVNELIKALGFEPIFFLADPKIFPYLLVVTEVWQTAGYGTIIYLASITSIDPALYEAARMDGANRFWQLWHITLPGMLAIIIVMATLSLGNVLNAGFDQILNLYSPVVYSTGDVLDTFTYRLGLVNNQYGIATAAGLFKSVISLIFIVTGYRLANKFAGYTVF